MPPYRSQSRSTEDRAGIDGFPGRVLLAEDDTELRKLLASALRKDGHQVIEVTDGDGLWSMMDILLSSGAPSEMPDVVVSDLRMPGRSGLDVLNQTGRDRWPTPFVLLTAFSDTEIQERAKSAGADLVLDKPVDVEHLKRVVRILCAF